MVTTGAKGCQGGGRAGQKSSAAGVRVQPLRPPPKIPPVLARLLLDDADDATAERLHRLPHPLGVVADERVATTLNVEVRRREVAPVVRECGDDRRAGDVRGAAAPHAPVAEREDDPVKFRAALLHVALPAYLFGIFTKRRSASSRSNLWSVLYSPSARSLSLRSM